MEPYTRTDGSTGMRVIVKMRDEVTDPWSGDITMYYQTKGEKLSPTKEDTTAPTNRVVSPASTKKGPKGMFWWIPSSFRDNHPRLANLIETAVLAVLWGPAIYFGEGHSVGVALLSFPLIATIFSLLHFGGDVRYADHSEPYQIGKHFLPLATAGALFSIPFGMVAVLPASVALPWVLVASVFAFVASNFLHYDLWNQRWATIGSNLPMAQGRSKKSDSDNTPKKKPTAAAPKISATKKSAATTKPAITKQPAEKKKLPATEEEITTANKAAQVPPAVPPDHT